MGSGYSFESVCWNRQREGHSQLTEADVDAKRQVPHSAFRAGHRDGKVRRGSAIVVAALVSVAMQYALTNSSTTMWTQFWTLEWLNCRYSRRMRATPMCTLVGQDYGWCRDGATASKSNRSKQSRKGWHIVRAAFGQTNTSARRPVRSIKSQANPSSP